MKTLVPIIAVIFSSVFDIIFAQISFRDHFSNCHMGDPRFDACIREAINSVRPYFKTGLPQYGVKPFDPFHCSEVIQTRGGPGMYYKLTLRNVTEAGWTASQVTRFKSDFKNNYIQVTQFFPDKRLNGQFEFDMDVLGTKRRNSGTWDLKLFDYTQTLTLSRKPRMVSNGTMVFDTPIKVSCDIHTCRHMELHISNLFGGRPWIENMADRLINTAWPPGFYLLRPLIGDLVGTAFTEIMDGNFRNFPFEQIIR